jgi:recombination protein RecR
MHQKPGEKNHSPYPMPFFRVIEALRTLPGIGVKTATKLAFHLLKSSDEEVFALSGHLALMKKDLVLCSVCQNIRELPEEPTSEDSVCTLCMDPSRDDGLIMVVEDVQTLYAVERSGEFRGLYHVLMGRLSPLDGIGPDSIRIKELIFRVETGQIREIIVATSPTTEGEATALYISRLFKPIGIRVTRIAFGIPVGLELEYVDDMTLIRSVEGRRSM